MSGELKPCPFCGNENPAILERTCDKHTPYNPNDRAYPVVRCRECGCEKPGLDWSGPETAVRNWNNRAALAKRDSVNRFVPCNEERACANCYSGQGECIAKREAVADVPKDAPQSFVTYMKQNYPPDTVIQDGAWHARAIWGAARYAMLAASQQAAKRPELADCKWTPETPDACPYCAGEACRLCGPDPLVPCEHDCVDRHQREASQQAAKGEGT